jgi:excisionase family DNA binding protein
MLSEDILIELLIFYNLGFTILGMPTESLAQDTASLPALMTIPQLCEYLNVEVSTVYMWRTRGRGPRGFRVGKKILFRQTDVVAWLEEQRRRSGSP